MLLSLIAQHLDGQLIGDPDIDIQRLVDPDDAQNKHDLVLLLHPQYFPSLQKPNIRTAVLIPPIPEFPPDTLDAYLVVEHHPRYILSLLTTLFTPTISTPSSIHPTAILAPDVTVGENVTVGPFTVINSGTTIGNNTVILSQVTIGTNVRIGAQGLIYPGVRIGDRVEIGNKVILHHNASIGADGFSFFTPQIDTLKHQTSQTYSEIQRIASLGTVIIGNEVEIGANSSIDRGTLTATRIGHKTKIDNLVQIGHNVCIGESCIICGHVGLSGSVQVGDRVVLAGHVGIADQAKIGDDVVIAAYSGVHGTMSAKQAYLGIPAVPMKEAIQQIAYIRKLHRFYTTLQDLKKRLKKLENTKNKE